MELSFLVLILSLAVTLSLSQQHPARSQHPYEFVRDNNRRAAGNSDYIARSGPPTARKAPKKSGVPPYAVLMEPVVQYSQPDPLYKAEKQSLVELKKKSFVTMKQTKEKMVRAEERIHRRTGHPMYDDADGEHSQQVEFSSYGTLYEGPPPEAPEPIIEIIIKESNQSLPAPPPLPSPPKKRKKEPVQVFYVKYKKDPSAYGEEKVIYEKPIPAVTPPANDESHEEEEEHQPEYHHEEATAAPQPSTTLKAIIRPDSETFHGSGLHITFGEPHEEDAHAHSDQHPGSYEQQSAPQPAVVYPSKTQVASPKVGGSPSQLTKRNPGPFHSQTLPPQQNFQSPVTQGPFHHQPPPATFQQTPQFPPQQFSQQQSPVQKTTFHHPAPVQAQPPRQPPPIQYSTLPQHLQQPQVLIPSPTHQFAPPRPQQPQPYQTINQQNFTPKPQNFRPQPQQYQQPNPTISGYHTLPQHLIQGGFPEPPPHQPQPHQLQPQPHQPQPQPHQPQPHQPQPHQPQLHQPQPHQLQSQPHQLQSQTHQLQPQSHQLQPQPHNLQPQPHQPIPHTHQLQPQTLQPQFQSQVLRPQPSPQPPQFIQPQPQRAPFLAGPPRPSPQEQLQHQHQVEQLNRLQQQQQYLQAQVQAQQFQQAQYSSTTYAPEIIKSISPQQHVSFPGPAAEKKPFVPQYSPVVQKQISTSRPTTTTEPTTTEEVVTEDPKLAEEQMKRLAEKHKLNVAALPQEVPDDLREQLLSSGILGNADIQILDYDKIGDIPIENLPPEALANFQAASAGSNPVPAVARPDDQESEPSEKRVVAVKAGRNVDSMEMKVVRYNPESTEGASMASKYMSQDAKQLEPVVLNDSKYNRYLPLKVSGAQFPVPDVPELRGRNVTSVVVLAPVDYEFLERRDKEDEESRLGRRSATPVLEVQGVHFVAGDVLKTLVKTPSSENYRRWLDKENMTAADKQSVVLLVVEPSPGAKQEKEIFMYDVASQRVSKLRGELSSTFVQVAESNSHNHDLEEISDNQNGDFTVKDTSPVSKRTRRKLPGGS